VERNKANESFPIPGLRRHALLCFAFEATKQQASAKKRKTPGAAAAATSIKRKILGRGRSAPFCSTAREILDAIARASKSTTSSTQYSHSNYCRRVRERWMRAAGESSADRASFFGRSKLMCCGRQRGGDSPPLRKRKAFSKSKMRPFLSVSLCTTVPSFLVILHFCRGAYSLCFFSSLDLLSTITSFRYTLQTSYILVVPRFNTEVFEG
jgi:hypothetical protein